MRLLFLSLVLCGSVAMIGCDEKSGGSGKAANTPDPNTKPGAPPAPPPPPPPPK